MNCTHVRMITYKVLVEPEDGAQDISNLVNIGCDALIDAIVPEGWTIIDITDSVAEPEEPPSD